MNDQTWADYLLNKAGAQTVSACLVREGGSQECGEGENKTFLFSKFKKGKDFWGQVPSHK